ncbi:MAG: AAA family ATPase [Candidatus Micrarchaeaceae archaeon]
MILGFIGNMGSGKTLSAVYLLSYFRKEYKIYTNMKNFKFNNGLITDPIFFLNETSNEKKIIFLDEIDLYSEARRSTSRENVLLSYLIFQSRKINSHFIWTAQVFGSVDIRIRDLTDVLIGCENLGYDNNYFYIQWTIFINKINIKKIIAKIPYDYIHVYDTAERILPENLKKNINKYLKNKEQ